MEVQEVARLPLQLLKYLNCTKCDLARTRTHVVLGAGSLPCDILFIGEAPGKTEDIRGLPFVGAAGIYLWKVYERCLEKLGFQERPKRFITNVVACRPVSLLDDSRGVENRPPTDVEMRACHQRLVDTYRLANPKIIITLGSTPATAFKLAATCKTFNVVHPAFVLRNSAAAMRFSRGLLTALEAYKERMRHGHIT